MTLNTLGIILYLAFMFGATIWFIFWVLPAISRWIALPPDEPKPDQEYRKGTMLHDLREVDRAVYDFRLAINHEMARLAGWMVRHLPKRKL